MENKAKTLSRRSLLAQMLEWPAKVVGLSSLMAAVPLISTGCGETKVSGPTDPEGQRLGNAGKKADLSENSETGTDTYQKDDATEGYQGDAARADATPPPNTANNQSATAEGLGNNGNNGTSGINGPRNTSFVQGARPNGGFFSRGAPQLTKAQIEAGQPIEATCEGSNHKLTITSEQLAQLAQGRTVQVRSATNTHFGNPTVHNHVVTYTPVRA